MEACKRLFEVVLGSSKAARLETTYRIQSVRVVGSGETAMLTIVQHLRFLEGEEYEMSQARVLLH